MAFDWRTLIGPAIGAGATVLGGQMQGNAANQNSNRQWELIQQEMARRNQMQGMVAPSLLRAIGYRNPGQINQMSSAIGGQSNPSPTSGAQPSLGRGASVPSNTASKVLGGAGAGIGLAGALGMGALGGPIGIAGGAALGLGSKLVNKIGEGRRTADTATQDNGFEKQFDQALAQAVQKRDAGDTEGAKQLLQQSYNDFMQGINSYRGMGGNYAKVADQAMNANPQKWATYNSIKQSLGLS